MWVSRVASFRGDAAHQRDDRHSIGEGHHLLPESLPEPEGHLEAGWRLLGRIGAVRLHVDDEGHGDALLVDLSAAKDGDGGEVRGVHRGVCVGNVLARVSDRRPGGDWVRVCVCVC